MLRGTQSSAGSSLEARRVEGDGLERREADSHAPEARKEGTLDVVADLPLTEAWWGHSGLANDSEDTEMALGLDIYLLRMSLPAS